MLIHTLPLRLFTRWSTLHRACCSPSFCWALCIVGSSVAGKPETIARIRDFGRWAPPVWFFGSARNDRR